MQFGVPKCCPDGPWIRGTTGADEHNLIEPELGFEIRGPLGATRAYPHSYSERCNFSGQSVRHIIFILQYIVHNVQCLKNSQSEQMFQAIITRISLDAHDQFHAELICLIKPSFIQNYYLLNIYFFL